MSLASRIAKLEIRLMPTKTRTCWLMWRDCQWKEAEGFIRTTNESIEDFKERVLVNTNQQFIWVK